MKPLPADLAALAAGGKGALARTLSALESAPDEPPVVALLDAAFAAPRGIVLGLTGPPGVGKSTLTRAIIARLRTRGETVGVIAVDPSSRRSGGALLGDRLRLETDPDDDGVFVRSMAARRHLGGLSELTFPATVLMRALFDVVLIETVGVGQSETEVSDCADLVLFCAQPGAGDALQFMKAGVTEVPDMVLVTKADLGAPARRAAADLRGALTLAARDAAGPGVALVSAHTGEGIEAAVAEFGRLAADRRRSGALVARRQDQARAWAESQIAESFGRAGLALIGSRLPAEGSPFASVTRLRARFLGVLYESFKNV
jgi:LAO/AO transport system kinase